MTAQNISTPAPTHHYGPDFDRAVDVARANIGITKSIVKEEFWSGFAIVKAKTSQGDAFRVYEGDAWERPADQGMLPWNPPTGEVVAHVNMEGEMHLTSNPRG